MIDPAQLFRPSTLPFTPGPVSDAGPWSVEVIPLTFVLEFPEALTNGESASRLSTPAARVKNCPMQVTSPKFVQAHTPPPPRSAATCP